MYIILTYDVNQKRVSKMLKICRKYLLHVQKSVFEGVITDGKLRLLKDEIQQVIDVTEDMVCIYCMESTRYVHKEEIGMVQNRSSII